MAHSSPKTDITIITGSTASGKTAFATEEAQRKNGVIINADAMQMYDALPILTAQPDANEQGAAPHRLYGSRPAGDDINAAEWRDMALAEIERCAQEGKHAIFVGGTNFYIMALIKGLSPIPDVDPAIREGLNTYRETRTAAEFFKEFASLDPVMAERLTPTDTQRIIRAWEILKGTGKSLAHWQDMPLITPPPHYHFHLKILQPEKDALNKRIRSRIDKMIAAGALEEVQALSERIDAGKVPETALIVKAHGFRPFRRYLKGESSLEAAKTQTDTETRQYAKRQRTWCRTQYTSEKLPATVTVEHIDV